MYIVVVTHLLNAGLHFQFASRFDIPNNEKVMFVIKITAVDMRGGGGHVPSIVCARVLSTRVVAVVARMVTLLAAAHRRLWDRQVTHMNGARATCASLHSCSARQPKLSPHFSHGSRGGQDRGREDHAGW